MAESLLSFLISFCIGLLLGIDRERSHPEGQSSIGVRTFVLFALLGTITATLKENIITVTSALFVFIIIGLGYYRGTGNKKFPQDVGITTELAAGMVFVLGYMVPTYPLMAITISAVILFVLVERKQLHRFSREKLSHEEIEAVIILTVFGLGVIPILPNETIDPWGLFNPKQFAILLALIAAIQFAGYVAIRLFGQRLGRAVTGFFGGFISSTAVFANLRVALQDGKFFYSTMAAALLATMASIIELAAIVLMASPTLFMTIIWPLVVMVMLGISIAAYFLMFHRKEKDKPKKKPHPLHYTSLIYSALIIAAIVVVTAIAKEYIGTGAIVIIAFLGGLFELHGVSLATALLFLENQITLEEASFILAVAILASFISKFILAFALTKKSFAAYLSSILGIILLSGAATYWLLSMN